LGACKKAPLGEKKSEKDVEKNQAGWTQVQIKKRGITKKSVPGSTRRQS